MVAAAGNADTPTGGRVPPPKTTDRRGVRVSPPRKSPTVTDRPVFSGPAGDRTPPQVIQIRGVAIAHLKMTDSH